MLRTLGYNLKIGDTLLCQLTYLLTYLVICTVTIMTNKSLRDILVIQARGKHVGENFGPSPYELPYRLNYNGHILHGDASTGKGLWWSTAHRLSVRPSVRHTLVLRLNGDKQPI